MTPAHFEGVDRLPVYPESAHRQLWQLWRDKKWVWWCGLPGQRPTDVEGHDTPCGTLGELAVQLLIYWRDRRERRKGVDPISMLPGLSEALIRTIWMLTGVIDEAEDYAAQGLDAPPLVEQEDCRGGEYLVDPDDEGLPY